MPSFSSSSSEMAMESQGEIRLSSQGMNVLWIPDQVAHYFLERGHQRVCCTLMGEVMIHSALLRHGDQGFGVYVNKKLMRQLGLYEGQQVSFVIDVDVSPNQFPMPEALEAALDQDVQAKQVFEALTPGARRGFMHWVGQVKSLDKQIERALKVTTHLKMGRTTVQKMLRFKDHLDEDEMSL